MTTETQRVALVTGASSGIGRATALALAADGYRVFAGMRTPTPIDGVEPIPLDVTDDASVAAAVSLVLEQAGAVDVLVNNAGIAAALAFEDTPIDEFARAIDTNYLGAVRCVKAVLPSMRERGSGVITCTSSVSGRVTAYPEAAYAPSKWALEAAFETLAMEVARFGIRVAIIEPGVTITPIFDKADVPPADTAYPFVYERTVAIFGGLLREAQTADDVAAEIVRIVADDDAPLRNLVGADAVALLEGRQAISDEEWVAIGAAVDDDEWYDGWLRVTGFDLRPPSAAAAAPLDGTAAPASGDRVAYLSKEWLDETVRRASSLPPQPGVDARIIYQITGGPNGDVTYHWVIEQAKLVGAALGPIDGADFTFRMAYDDAVEIERGRLDDNTAFLQGKIAFDGSMAKLMALMPALSSPGYRTLQTELREVTSF